MTTHFPSTVALIGACCALAVACTWPAGVLAAKAEETVKRSLTLAPVEGRRVLVVRNVSGAISIEGAGRGDRVDLTVHQVWKADDEEELARAREEVRLEVKELSGRLELVQEGPWHCKQGGCCCGDRDYEARFDWTIVVPRDVELEIRNVNDGAIRIENVSGTIQANHVNDDVTLENVSGGVAIDNVNGEIDARFAAAPKQDIGLRTVNGDVEVTLPKDVGAELRARTVNGEVSTDLPFQPALRPTSEHGKRKLHRRGVIEGRIGEGGGITVDCQTVNGDIAILGG